MKEKRKEQSFSNSEILDSLKSPGKSFSNSQILDLLDNYECILFEHSLTRLNADSSNLTILLSLDIVSHFHSFEDKNGVASLYFVAYGNLDFCNNTRKWRLNSICCIYVCSACCRLFACSLLVRIAENNLLLFRLLLPVLRTEQTDAKQA